MINFLQEKGLRIVSGENFKKRLMSVPIYQQTGIPGRIGSSGDFIYCVTRFDYFSTLNVCTLGPIFNCTLSVLPAGTSVEHSKLKVTLPDEYIFIMAPTTSEFNEASFEGGV